MELTLNDLRDLITLTSGHFSPFEHLQGRRVLTRTYMSGVTVGTAVAIHYGPVITVEFKDAVRVWSWSDGALSVSEMARTGADCKIDRHPDGLIITAIDFEIHPVTDTAWKAITNED